MASRRFIGGAGLLLSALMLAHAASAASSDALCGAYAFPQWPDALFREDAAARARRAGVSHNVGDQETLWIYDYAAEKHEQIVFTYRAVNQRSSFLVDDRYWSLSNPDLINPDDLARLSEVFERNAGPPPGLGRGIYEVETSTYTGVTPVQGDGMVYIALTEIRSNLADGYIVGYVNPGDRLTKDNYQYSNERNLIVIDAASRTPTSRRERTLSHEFFHIIHRGVDPNELRWVDEGIAVYSQTISGYEGNSGEDLFDNPNIGLFDAGTQLSLADYDKAYLIMRYMADQYGSDLISRIARSTLKGTPGIDAALSSLGSTHRFSGDVFPAWAVANLSAPHPTSRYAYRVYDPRPHQPGSFGDAGPLPIQEQRTLVAWGLRYVRAPDPNVAGDFIGSPIPVWNVMSVEQAGDAIVPRAWFQLDYGKLRDCSLNSPWLVIMPLAVAGSEHSYTLDWRAPTVNPAIVSRGPTGAGVVPYTARIRAEFSNLEPGQSITVTATSMKTGLLARDIRVTRSGLQGRCGETVVIVDSSSAPLPPDDIITVQVSDLYSAFGDVLTSHEASWQFGTGAADTEPPLVTIGVLPNPALPSYITVVVCSNEALYPDGQGAVRLIMNGNTTVALQPQDAAKKTWVGTVSLPAAGQYNFALHATDLAGNAPTEPNATYALAPTSEATARPAVHAAGGR